jgi:hypothetical protein
VYSNPEESTRRTSVPPPKVASRNPAPRNFAGIILKAAVATVLVLFFATVFSIVYAIRMYNNAEPLRRAIDSGQMSIKDGAAAYRKMANQSLFSFPLHWVRNSLRDRYVAEADRVLADYREASESTPVYSSDWKRAQSALASAVEIAPEDKSIRGKARLVDGFLRLRAGELKAARSDFEEGRSLLPHSPDPHLGLANIYMADGDLDKAEHEMEAAESNGFHRGRREEKGFADGYKKRGERWITEAKHAHDIGHMEDALRHADGDLSKAQSLYNSVAPFLNGVELAEKVSVERDQAAKSLAAAQQAQQAPQPTSDQKETP